MCKNRCYWSSKTEIEKEYHDTEWGVPLHDDAKLFEFLLLETFQAGLSWLTILRKRENFKEAFDNFDYTKIAKYSDDKIETLLQNEGIIRNRLKVKAAISNAQVYMNIQKQYGSFDNYFWSFSNNEVIKNAWQNQSEVPATTPLSDKISKDMKKQGFKFVGSTVIYATMQAIGMVNDHTTDCFRYNQV